MPASQFELAGLVAEQAAQDLAPLLSEADFDELMVDAVDEFTARGLNPAAKAVVKNIRDTMRRERAVSLIECFEAFYSLVDLSVFDKAFFQLASEQENMFRMAFYEQASEKERAARMVVRIRKGEIDDAVNQLLDRFMNQPADVIISDVFYLTPAVINRWGADDAQSVVDWIDEFDHRLTAGTELIAQGGS